MFSNKFLKPHLRRPLAFFASDSTFRAEGRGVCSNLPTQIVSSYPIMDFFLVKLTRNLISSIFCSALYPQKAGLVPVIGIWKFSFQNWPNPPCSRTVTLYKGNVGIRLVIGRTKVVQIVIFQHCHENKSVRKLNFWWYRLNTVNRMTKFFEFGLVGQVGLLYPLYWVGYFRASAVNGVLGLLQGFFNYFPTPCSLSVFARVGYGLSDGRG